MTTQQTKSFNLTFSNPIPSGEDQTMPTKVKLIKKTPKRGRVEIYAELKGAKEYLPDFTNFNQVTAKDIERAFAL